MHVSNLNAFVYEGDGKMLPASQRSRKPSRQSHGESQGNLQISTEEAAMKQETRCSSLAPSRPSHLCFHAPTPMTYSIVKLPLRQRLGSEWAGLMCIPSPLQFAELPWSQRREGQRGTEKRASMAALHKLRGYEAGREFCLWTHHLVSGGFLLPPSPPSSCSFKGRSQAQKPHPLPSLELPQEPLQPCLHPSSLAVPMSLTLLFWKHSAIL